jgi:hypothetical protein
MASFSLFVNLEGQLSNPSSLHVPDNITSTNFADFDFNKLVELADWLRVVPGLGQTFDHSKKHFG